MRFFQRGDNSPGKLALAGLFVAVTMMIAPIAVNAINLPYNLLGTHSEATVGSVITVVAVGSVIGINQLTQSTFSQPIVGARAGNADEAACPIPEPATLVLLSSGLGMMLLKRVRKTK